MYKFTEDDKAICRYALLCGYKFMTVDKYGSVVFHVTKPERYEVLKAWQMKKGSHEAYLIKAPGFLSPDDPEPFLIPNMIKGQKTNGDKIRSMTDEELLRFILDVEAGRVEYCDGCPEHERCKSEIEGPGCVHEDTDDIIREWIKRQLIMDNG